MQNIRHVSWREVEKWIDIIRTSLNTSALRDYDYCIQPARGRGGLIPAVMLSHAIGVPLLGDTIGMRNNVLWIDDIIDSGRTLLSEMLTKSIVEEKCHITYCALVSRVQHPHLVVGEMLSKDDWIAFPWERNHEQDRDQYALRSK